VPRDGGTASLSQRDGVSTSPPPSWTRSPSTSPRWGWKSQFSACYGCGMRAAGVRWRAAVCERARWAEPPAEPPSPPSPCTAPCHPLTPPRPRPRTPPPRTSWTCPRSRCPSSWASGAAEAFDRRRSGEAGDEGAGRRGGRRAQHAWLVAHSSNPLSVARLKAQLRACLGGTGETADPSSPARVLPCPGPAQGFSGSKSRSSSPASVRKGTPDHGDAGRVLPRGLGGPFRR
jgi:hypothetical protein